MPVRARCCVSGMKKRWAPTGCPVGAQRYWLCGGVLLSRRVAPAVPSALAGLASGFGMGPGVSPPPWPPQHVQAVSLSVSRRWRGPGRACEPGSGCESRRRCVGTLVRGGWVSPRPISTRPLNPLPGVHAGPINPMVCGGPYPINVGGRPHLEAGFPLRCFQRLSNPNVANQPCPWRDNWHTRGPSIPVLSY